MKFIHLLLCSVFTFFVLYGPQPILPLLAKSYQLTSAEAGLLMTATMLPLAIAPLLYGYLLLRINSLSLLRLALLLLAISCALFPLAQTFQQLLIIRFLHGLLLPAALTAMTITSIQYTYSWKDSSQLGLDSRAICCNRGPR